MIRRTLLAGLFLAAVALASPGTAQVVERAGAHGVYLIECHDAQGRLKWRDIADNTVVTVGKNLALDAYLSGAAYTVTGPYIGLISSTSFGGITGSDTMSSHSGWLEAGAANNPQYTGPRPTAAFSAASGGSKALSARLAFSVTVAGDVQGAFLVYGPGAVATIDNTGGTLYSASSFAGAPHAVVSGDTISLLYTASL